MYEMSILQAVFCLYIHNVNFTDMPKRKKANNESMREKEGKWNAQRTDLLQQQG